jgi:DNA-binding transcriptional regulator YiaG
MSDRVHKARTEVTLAMQAYSLALRYEKQTIQEWDAVQKKVDALIAAVREAPAHEPDPQPARLTLGEP